MLLILTVYDAQVEPSRLRKRTKFSHEQLYKLDKQFDLNNNADSAQLYELAIELGLPEKTIIAYFRNRRAKEKRILRLMKSTRSTISNDKFKCVLSKRSSIPWYSL